MFLIIKTYMFMSGLVYTLCVLFKYRVNAVTFRPPD